MAAIALCTSSARRRSTSTARKSMTRAHHAFPWLWTTSPPNNRWRTSSWNALMKAPQLITPPKRSPTLCSGSVAFPLPPVSKSALWEGAPPAMMYSKILRHLYFFSSTLALQKYMNRALRPIPARCRPMKMSFINDEVIFTQSDMDKSNFSIDKNGKICMLDFEDVVLLPESFSRYTMNDADPFVKKVAGYLEWPRTPNGYAMARASAFLIMSS